MKSSNGQELVSPAVADGQPPQPEPAHTAGPSTTETPDDNQSKMDVTPSHAPPCVKPFDRWTPLGGGAENDIFRRFNILPTEEEAFLTYWARTSSGKGILSRDETGTLTFRISSANIAELADMHIGRTNGLDHSAQWLHVYDQEGVSWLTQSANSDQSLAATRETIGQPNFANCNLGRYGPSGLTVKEFVERRLNRDTMHTLSAKM